MAPLPRGSDRVRVAVLAPSPILTVTLEHGVSDPELHLHPGGQGFWVARMALELGATVALCAPFGGEVGAVLRSLAEREGFEVCPVRTAGCNGAYVRDRRDDIVSDVGETASPRLARHEVDALYGTMLSASLEADLAVLTGPRGDGILDSDFYERLANDFGKNDRTVIADLSGAPLESALAGGIDLLHLSERELGEREGDVGPRRGAAPSEIRPALERLREAGAQQVVLTRGPDSALVLLDSGMYEFTGPRFEPREPRGPGDSMVAAIAVCLAGGDSLQRAVRMGVAAGALNATRRGLGTGSREDVERLAPGVTSRRVGAAGPQDS